MSDADDLHRDLVLRIKKGFRRPGQGLDGAGRRLLDQNIPALAVLKGKQHQVDRLLQAHDKAGHAGLRDGDGLALADLLDPQGHNATTGAENVAVARAADLGVPGRARLRHGDLFHHGLAGPHGVHGVGGLVGRETDHAAHASLNGGGEHVIRAKDIGFHRLQREKLAGGDLLQRGGVEDVIHPDHRVFQRLQIAHIADVELDLVRNGGIPRLVFMPHVVLLFLIPGENADLADVRLQKAVQHRVAEGAGASGDEECFAGKSCF